MEDPTLVIHLTFTAVALVVMTARIAVRIRIFGGFDTGDYLTLAAIVCAVARGGLIHVVLTWGTNNLSTVARGRIDFTDEEIYRRTIGSKFAISNRPIYNTYLWCQKLILLHFYIRHFHSHEKRRHRLITWTYGPIFFATWLAAQVVGFTECDPFRLYWQVVPSAGTCVQAQVQLIVLGVLNIGTDVMLLILPIPSLISLQTPWRLKLRLYALCTLGLFIIAITVIRLPINALNATVQANRTTWASTELLAAAIAVNAPTLYGAYNNWRRLRNGIVSSAYTMPGQSASRRPNSATISDSRFGHINIGLGRKIPDEEDEITLNMVMQGKRSGTSMSYASNRSASQGDLGVITKTREVCVRDFEGDRVHVTRNESLGWNEEDL
ncbi:hypothetical protein CAC42_947 [Sphaceloma murrayae]|uniref:Rhodopsin domain-containing protein n=1 Tax=Sphaceloma murrayae TaxID=2082308 RepID=A0A2K1R2S6_9PEZI|nr:hypothetical protein CAC42_947 [Sphaceloma murrayae]